MNKWVIKPRNKYNVVLLKIEEEKENLKQGLGWLGLLEIKNWWEKNKRNILLFPKDWNKEIVNLFKIIVYLQNIISIHPISY